MKRFSPARRLALFGTALAALGASLLSPAVQAQTEWPTKTVRIILPYPVGGGPDGVARLVADKLARKWGKPVIVENRPGANGFIAVDAFKRGATDGHDLLQLDSVHIAAYPYMFKKLPYDVDKDFDAIVPLFRTYLFFTVAQNSKYKKVSDIIADAKANPGKLNYGSWSIGNPVHLGMEEFQQATGTKFEHVLYKETTQLYTSVATEELFSRSALSSWQGLCNAQASCGFWSWRAPSEWPRTPTCPPWRSLVAPAHLLKSAAGTPSSAPKA